MWTHKQTLQMAFQTQVLSSAPTPNLSPKRGGFGHKVLFHMEVDTLLMNQSIQKIN